MARASSLLRHALQRVERCGTREGTNIVAYSGGVDSSLVAALLHTVYPRNSMACIGLSASLPTQQLQLAHTVARHIGILLNEVATAEGQSPEYIANKGMSCFHCKTHLYTALETVAAHAEDTKGVVRLFNGTNAEDHKDPTRVGLRAARNFQVQSPIDHLTKAQVRELARELGLPNWRHAASPCLRSRLAFGVPALEAHLRRIEAAESAVRKLARGLDVQHNLRVRMLAGEKAVVEMDSEMVDVVQVAYSDICTALMHLGFASVDVRAFRSGSVSAVASTDLVSGVVVDRSVVSQRRKAAEGQHDGESNEREEDSVAGRRA